MKFETISFITNAVDKREIFTTTKTARILFCYYLHVNILLDFL